ncbi:MAG: 50S ribosomal protein L17 [Candidatus Aegiribacteria sp.]|nr:50S ribosomal protein L17 [Candidatus Aegiribacteria sp.]MBD3294612.1 50S ribosomal protein L17 [Candidatus Fermentibacteria bacterium]
MRHRKKVAKLGRKPEARRRMLRSLVTSLIMEERIRTSLVRAKAARSAAEKVITRAREDTVQARRQVAKSVYGSEAVQKVFDELGPRYADRNGGYTRILKLGPRKGDAAEECILELVDSPVETS